MIDETKAIDFKAIRLKLASPEKILDWSHGEVTRPETINYRTQKPEKDGLFCERIFGPSKDWECYCGKYKRIRYKGIVCDKCGVEVTRSIVRRERMGHIKLSAPVSHIWFLRGVPSKIGLVLGLSIQDLEKVIYFANFIVTQVDEELKKETLDQISKEYSAKVKSIEENYSQRANKIKQNKVEQLAKEGKEGEKKKIEERINQELFANAEAKNEELRNLEETVTLARKELKELKPKLIISENRYQDLSLKYGHIFEAGIGAEAIHKLLKEIDFDKTIKELEKETIGAPENKRKRVSRRLRLLKNLKKNGIRPDWMVISIIPVIPPDLRPMVQLDGGRFATSDLNDLYRRVINRNNRLKKLIELNAPEVICRNEKRMLQEAVDALIDNGARRGKTVTASTGQKRMLKSIADILKGKQGRFRQNLLGKRVDYSGRSVIVIGPNLKLDECGLPKRMALELFRPFVISQLIKREYVHNVRSAGRFIETGKAEVWDILEEVTKNAHVMLNRAPTLHRLGIQAFKPKLIEGKAIQIHPLVCSAFNADFDGDQMAVHLPLTEQAKEEAKNLMLSTNNLLKPATGAPVTTPSQDIVLGCYYLTLEEEEKKERLKNFSSREEALLAYHSESIKIHEPIMVPEKSKLIKTTPGRIIFNSILPKELQYINKVLDKKALSAIVTDSLTRLGQEKTAQILDDIKKLSFEYLTQSGISWGMDDLPEVKKKNELIKQAEAKVEEIEQHYNAGLLTDKERQVKVIETWAKIKEEIQEVCRQSLDKSGPVYTMIESGSRGSWGQITQMMGMKGLVTNPAGETIELPVKGSFKDGFDVLEYFISTHGARKGLSDTALRTANAGYLTRRLIDVSQEVVVNEKDCKDNEGFIIKKEEAEETGDSLAKRVWGRVIMDDILDKKSKKIVVKKGTLVDEEIAKQVEKADPDQVRIRSVLSCKARRGICQKCYGFDLGYNKLVELGTAIGIIAAQSIGEPGTQLTMRTFHTGGVAGQDITQGLPRVEELFEARPVKKAAIVSEVDGIVSISEVNDNKLIKVNYIEDREEILFENKSKLNPEFIKVKDGQKVKKQAIVYEDKKKEIKAPQEGNIKLEENKISLIYKKESVKEYSPPVGYSLWFKEGDLVAKGQSLTEGSINLFDIFRLSGIEATQKYIMKEIQYIYSSQGQKLNDKHVEVIVRQMFSRVLVKDAGETELLSGEIVDRNTAEIANKEAEKKGAKKAILEPMLLGITKASLTTDSFLSAASFQETARVLIDAAITGKVDKLRGLKENVIIGKLIPAGTGYKKSE